jgi:hypothetical protein
MEDSGGAAQVERTAELLVCLSELSDEELEEKLAGVDRELGGGMA